MALYHEKAGNASKNSKTLSSAEKVLLFSIYTFARFFHWPENR